MFWFKRIFERIFKEKKIESFKDSDYTARQMHKFLADAEALKPYKDISQEAYNAYNVALNGIRMSCVDYCTVLKEQGLMSR